MKIKRIKESAGYRIEMLRQAKLPVHQYSEHHFRIGGHIDFWPSTCRYIDRRVHGLNRQAACVAEVIQYIKEHPLEPVIAPVRPEVRMRQRTVTYNPETVPEEYSPAIWGTWGIPEEPENEGPDGAQIEWLQRGTRCQ